MTISNTTSRKYYGRCSPGELPPLTWPRKNIRNIWQNLRQSEKQENQCSFKIYILIYSFDYCLVSMLSYFRNCWSSKCHQFVFLSFKFSHFIYSPFPHRFSVPRWFFPLEFHHILTLKFPWWKFEMNFLEEKDQEHILHINWLVISETDESLGTSDLLRWWNVTLSRRWFVSSNDRGSKGHSLKSPACHSTNPKTMHDFWCKALKDTICSGNFMIPVISSYLFLGGPTKIFWKTNHPGPVGSCLAVAKRRKAHGARHNVAVAGHRSESHIFGGPKNGQKKDEGIFLVIFDVISCNKSFLGIFWMMAIWPEYGSESTRINRLVIFCADSTEWVITTKMTIFWAMPLYRKRSQNFAQFSIYLGWPSQQNNPSV